MAVRALIPCGLALAVAFLSGCATAGEGQALTTPGPRPRVAAGATRVSLFERPWLWTDDRGARVRFADWRGRPVVLAAIYTSCNRTCPLTLGGLRAIAARLARDGREAEFIVVTLDPAHDTPERLREFKREAGLPDAWHLVRGDAGETADIADLLDIHVVSLEAHVMHDSRVAVFGASGALAARFDCCDFASDAAVAVGLAR